MKSAPEISVITATYNDELYLSQSVESILNQTFPNFELDVRSNLDIKNKIWYPHRYEKRNRSR